MKRLLILLCAISILIRAGYSKTLIAYYSYTGNCRSIVNELKKQYIENPEVYLTYTKFRVDGMTRLPDWSPTGMLWQAESFNEGAKR